jgi:hypothetical protein
MPTVHVEANISTGELLRAAEQLTPTELEKFVHQILALRARRIAPTLTAAETELVLRVNRGLPDIEQRRYNELIAKRREETLTTEEHRELLRLTEASEKVQAERVAALAELARLRNTSIDTLMNDLGISAPSYE